MREVKFKLYKFDELPEETKAKVIQYFQENFDYDIIISEAHETFEKFCKIFSINWREIDYFQFYRSSWKYNFDDDVLNMDGLRLAKYLWNNYKEHLFKGKFYWKGDKSRHSKIILEKGCVLTGTIYDEYILQPIYEFLQEPKKYVNIAGLLDRCIKNFVKAVQEDIDFMMQDEQIIDFIVSNEFEFYQNGKVFNEYHLAS